MHIAKNTIQAAIGFSLRCIMSINPWHCNDFPLDKSLGTKNFGRNIQPPKFCTPDQWIFGEKLNVHALLQLCVSYI